MHSVYSTNLPYPVCFDFGDRRSIVGNLDVLAISCAICTALLWPLGIHDGASHHRPDRQLGIIFNGESLRRFRLFKPGFQSLFRLSVSPAGATDSERTASTRCLADKSGQYTVFPSMARSFAQGPPLVGSVELMSGIRKISQ